ncbi:MAG: hypothetical protein NTY39_11965 [Campylobacterales bacterium]|jgi:hypothetical protein|nr:hypothetical protein [Campylobacterales bacterium]
MSATLRKNFVFDAIVVSHLEEIARVEGLSLTKAINNMIEQRYEEIAKQKRIEAFESLILSIQQGERNPFLDQFAPDDNKVIQKVKAMME